MNLAILEGAAREIRTRSNTTIGPDASTSSSKSIHSRAQLDWNSKKADDNDIETNIQALKTQSRIID
ncbi:hypothetical protein AZE42_02282 [Rhizopogon vesiculosus]|uniref:Uncharacterized protein n=1 Tax=Rhizopogon vesiculosus TaxID=180088 RepID=A0A1J8QJ60_9AGAM|nr:hypothetical protein AZE42_02282 [Rhizopogon vesiculosus]